MRTYIAGLLFFSLSWINAKSQSESNGLLTTLYKGQKQYITDTIQQKQQSKYLALLHFANVIHPKVLDEIQKINASFSTNGQNINILEGFSDYSNLNGIIWQDDSIYYSYYYGADKKLTVAQRLFSQLNDTTRTIVQNFGNWNNATFATKGQALGGPTDHSFFLASKISNISEPIQTIGFYFY